MGNKNITCIHSYSSDDINYLYRKITEDIVVDGNSIKFGNKYEIKNAREIFAIVQIYGKAINKILNGITPQKFRWSGKKIKDYQQSFLIPIKKIKEKSINNNKMDQNQESFEYTYIDLLRNYKNGDCYIDQIELSKNKLKEDLELNIQSNQNVGILYNPSYSNLINPPCFNWYQIRLLSKNEVSLRLLFRSNDYGDAVWANLCGIAFAFNELVIKNNGCILKEIILISTSAHIYDKESDLAEEVSGFKWNRFNNDKMNPILNLLGHDVL